MPILVFDLDDGRQVAVPLMERMGLGRGDGNDILVEDPRVADFHAEFYRHEDGAFWVRNLEGAGSSGTFVNGSAVSAARLQEGDELMLGPIQGRYFHDDEAYQQQVADAEAARLAELYEESARLDRRIAEQMAEIRTLNVHVSSGQRAWESRKVELEAAQAAVDALRAQAAEETERLAVLRQTALTLTEQASAKENAAHRDQLFNLGEEVSAATQLLGAKRAEIDQAQADLVSSRSLHDDLRTAYDLLLPQVEQLRVEGGELSESKAALTQAQGRIRSEMTAAEAQLQAARADQAAIATALASDQQRRDSVLAETRELTAELQRLAEQKEKIQGELGTLRADQDALAQSLQQSRHEVQDTNYGLEALRLKQEKAAHDVEHAKSDLEKLRRQEEELQTKVKQLQEESARLTADRTRSELHTQETLKANQLAQADLVTGEERLRAVESSRLDAERGLAELESRRRVLIEEVESLQSQVLAGRAGVLPRSAAEHEGDEEEVELASQRDKLKSELAQLTIDRDQLASAVAEARQALQHLEEQYDVSQQQWATWYEEVSRLQTEHEQYLEHLHQAVAQRNMELESLGEHLPQKESSSEAEVEGLASAGIQARPLSQPKVVPRGRR